MADHYAAAAVQLERVDQIRARLAEEYRHRDHDKRVVASLHAELGNAMKLAEIHATLSVAQAVTDLRLPA